MKDLFKKTSALFAVVAVFTLGNAFGQKVDVMGDKPSFDDLPSPEFAGGKQKPFKPKDWLEMEVKLKVALSPEPRSKTCEKLTVKWYVAVKNPDKPSTYLLLSKDVDYVNVPLNEEIYCSVYLSPASIKRLTGMDRSGKTAVECVGYEVLLDGEKVAEGTNRKAIGWWSSGSDKISRTDTVPLLTKPQTPFASMWWDRYAEVGDSNK